jgi:hypothetical protein
VDGDRETPRRSTAENWSRRDGIRAGSVSGPWRSAPRAEGTEPAAPEAPASVVSRPGRLAGPRRARVVWIGLGCLVIAGCVAAALLLRPDLPGPAEAPASEAEAAAEPAPADPALAAIGSVRVRAPALAPERRDAIVAALTDGGIAAVEVEALPFPVETSRVGFYRAPDRAAAEALARLAAPLVTPGASLPVRDYGKLVDDPEPGRLDLWIRN